MSAPAAQPPSAKKTGLQKGFFNKPAKTPSTPSTSQPSSTNATEAPLTVPVQQVGNMIAELQSPRLGYWDRVLNFLFGRKGSKQREKRIKNLKRGLMVVIPVVSLSLGRFAIALMLEKYSDSKVVAMSHRLFGLGALVSPLEPA